MVLPCISLYHMLSYSIVGYWTAFYCIKWCILFPYGIAWCCIVLHCIALYCIVSYGILWYLMTPAWYCMLLRCWLWRAGCVSQDAYILHRYYYKYIYFSFSILQLAAVQFVMVTRWWARWCRYNRPENGSLPRNAINAVHNLLKFNVRLKYTEVQSLWLKIRQW